WLLAAFGLGPEHWAVDVGSFLVRAVLEAASDARVRHDLAEALDELALEVGALSPRVRAAHARISRTKRAGMFSRFASRSSRSIPSVMISPKTRTLSQVVSSSR